MEMELQREHFLHQRKLSAVRAIVDTRRPRPQPHLSAKCGKKLRRHQEELQSIQKNNELLLGKMLQIDIRPMSVGRPQTQGAPSYTSLNRIQRISELKKISDENKTLLLRLRKTHSRYSVRRWDQEHERSEYLASLISENASRVPAHRDYPGNASFALDRPATARTSHTRARSARASASRSDLPL